MNKVYKQQMANISMEGKNERRYFSGVLGTHMPAHL